MLSVRQYIFLYGTLLGSMMTGASFVHHVLKPDLSLAKGEEATALEVTTPSAAASGAAPAASATASSGKQELA